MVGQSIVRAIEVEPLVLDASAEIPFAGDEEAVVVAKIGVKRIALAEFGVAKIAAERVVALEEKKIVRVFVLRFGFRLILGGCAGKSSYGRGEKHSQDREFNFLH